MTSTARVEPLYISAAASRNNASASRTTDGLIAFASGHLISLWNSANDTHEGIHTTLTGHGAEVSALKFSNLDQHILVSGDRKGNAKLWRQEGESIKGTWKELASLPNVHSGSVSAVETLALSSEGGESKYLVVTGGSNASIKVSIVDSATGQAEQVQKIDCRGKIPLELALSYLPQSKGLVLAVGSTENRIQLYTSPSASSPKFTKSLSLEGHTDWIRCLSFTTPIPSSASPSSSTSTTNIGYDINPGEVLLASGGQDNYIRLWRFTRLSHSTTTSKPAPANGLSALDELEKALAEKDPSVTSTAGGGKEGELRVKAHDFSIEGDGEFSCASEAVLLGHDAWVTGLNWAPSDTSRSSSSTTNPGLRLLSASADRSMILWTPLQTNDLTTSATSTLWTSQHRFGEFSSVTNLGFFGALWGKDAKTVMASGWGGSWHVWDQKDEEGAEWEPKVAATGHLGKVCQVVWEPEGEYLLSASHDMSTRLHAPWRRQSGNDGRLLETWHELGRPQIHGYPLSSLSFIDRLQFVSGADEKLIRVFDAPQNFVDSLDKLSKVKLAGAVDKPRPMAANVPPLGLSNRAIASQAEADQLPPASNDPFEAVAPVNFSVNEQHPPLEEQLLGSTLWPETEKLYGHSFELVALCSAHRSPLIASACKATLPSHALIRLYDTRTWLPVRTEGGILEGHSLTITKLEFSRDDKWLLSVSRDRCWRVYERIEGEEKLGYRPVAMEKAHARIIWDACWSLDSSFFATASRDKTTKIWTRASSNSGWECSKTLKFDEAATSIATTYLQSQQLHLLSIGLENGQIHLYTSPVSAPSDFSQLSILDPTIAHVLAVTSLSFCPKQDLAQDVVARLASGSEDKSVRIFDIKL
ncbi:Elongator subunit ELP2 [Sporobolomyces salmoneus]|uniref:Elongator subunit ELP2 n=1 Tax=Sporobolomyces salmoneus TaxID=183962 RepID=UPI00317A1FD0